MSRGIATATENAFETAFEADFETRLNDIAGVLNTQYGALVDIVIEMQAHPERWSGDGVWTVEQFLAWRMGLSPATAAALVIVAGRSEDLPVSIQAFRDGQLSLDQMAAIARKAPWWTDAESCEYGTTLTVAQLRRVMSRYPFPILDADGREVRDEPVAIPAETDGPPDSSDESMPGTDPDIATESFCHWFVGDDGRFRLNANLDQETGDVVANALSGARDQLFLHGQTDVDGADALREVCERSLDAIDSPRRRSRFKIAMFFETDGTMTDTGGRVVPESMRQHLSCNGTITPVTLDNGLPVSVGRTQHIVPDRTRTLIERRDQGRCRVPGCNSQLGLEVHHIIHWEHDGPTDTWNLILICAHHHRMHHRGKLGITGNADLPDGIAFTNSSGLIIRQSGAAPNHPIRPPDPPPDPYQHPLGEPLRLDWVLFNPPEAHRRELLERQRAAGGTAADYLDSFKRRN